MKILAIDIGTALIKCVLVESKFKRFDLIQQDLIPLDDALTPFAPNENQVLSPGQIQALSAIAARYAGERSKSVDRIVCNLPLSLYASRLLSFPFKDKKKLHSAVRFALEDEIPFDLDDCVFSTHTFLSKQKETHVLTGYAPTAPLSNFLETMQGLGLNPDALTMDHSSLSSLLFRQKNPDASFALLNLGHRKSSITIYRDQIPVLHQTIMVGGLQLTQAIAQKYQMSLPEAEHTKCERAFYPAPGMQLNTDQQHFASVISESLEPIFASAQKSLMAFASRYNENIDRIYLCGGTSLIPGLAEALESRWDKKVSLFSLSSRFPSLTIQPSRATEALIIGASALGIAQLSGEAKTQINFRSGKLRANHRQLNLNFQQFVYPAKILSAIYLFAFLSLLGQMFALQKELSLKEAKLDKTIQSVFGKTSASFLSSLKASPQRLKAGVEKKIEESAQESDADAQGPSFSTLEALLLLSKNVPRSTVMELRKIEMTPMDLSVQVESPSQKDAESALSILSKLPKYQAPKAGPIENTKNNRKRFSLTLQKGSG